MTEKLIIADLDDCNGCRICEVACSVHSEVGRKYNKSSIKVLSNKEVEVHIPVLDMRCDFCGKCVEWCPTKALSIMGLEEAMSARRSAKVGKIPIARISASDS